MNDRDETIQRKNLFSIPVWCTRVPAFEPHRDALIALLSKAWKRGEFQVHRHGYGYQSPSEIFSPAYVQRYPSLEILKKAFVRVCTRILQQRVGLSSKLPFRIYCVRGWVLLQTNEQWVSGPWHDHYPGLLSGAYYLQIPETEDEAEGSFQMRRPDASNLFAREIEFIKPAAGDMIVFPSQLLHRPAPCPSARCMRITIAMDAYVHWIHPDEEDREPIAGTEYNRMIDDSMGRSSD